MTEPKTKVDTLREAIAKVRATERAGEDSSAPRATSSAGSTAASPPTEGELPGAETEQGEDLAARLHAAEEEVQIHQDRLLRIMAEFENFRKRTERTQAESIAFANERLLRELTPILDHLDEALSHLPGDAVKGDEDAPLRVLAEGVELTRRQFLTVLEKFGFTEVVAEVGTRFDPACHEAMTQIDAEDIEAGAIVKTARRGYTLHGRLVRAALVVVAK